MSGSKGGIQSAKQPYTVVRLELRHRSDLADQVECVADLRNPIAIVHRITGPLGGPEIR